MTTDVAKALLEQAVFKFKPGLYRHYKGGIYTALVLARHHDSGTPFVLYVSHTHGTVNVRPLLSSPDDPDGWADIIGTVPRFQYLGSSIVTEMPSTQITVPK